MAAAAQGELKEIQQLSYALRGKHQQDTEWVTYLQKIDEIIVDARNQPAGSQKAHADNEFMNFVKTNAATKMSNPMFREFIYDVYQQTLIPEHILDAWHDHFLPLVANDLLNTFYKIALQFA